MDWCQRSGIEAGQLLVEVGVYQWRSYQNPKILDARLEVVMMVLLLRRARVIVWGRLQSMAMCWHATDRALSKEMGLVWLLLLVMLISC